MTFRRKRLGLTMWGTEPAASISERIGFDSVWLL